MNPYWEFMLNPLLSFWNFVVSLSNPIYDKTKRREKGKAKRKRPSFSISNVFGLNQISKVVHFSFFFTFGMLHLVLLSSLMIRLWFFNLILPFFFFWSWQVSNWVLNHMIEKFSLGGFVLKGNLQLTRLELLTLWLEASQIWSTHHFRWIWHGTTLIFCHGSAEFKTLLDDAYKQGLTRSKYFNERINYIFGQNCFEIKYLSQYWDFGDS